MSNKKIADYYDDVYAQHAEAFTGDPLPLVLRLLEYTNKGTVLELGAGRGRNALFLAAKGFDVTATDISPVSVAGMAKKGKEDGVLLKTQVLDMEVMSLVGSYDVIICTFTLHHMKREDALAAVRSMREHTNPLGFNIVTAFTKNGDFYSENPTTPNFYLDGSVELEQLYHGWNILKSFEKDGKARTSGQNGEPMFNVFAGLLAQKNDRVV